jgi:probable rRNA maturation factor
MEENRAGPTEAGIDNKDQGRFWGERTNAVFSRLGIDPATVNFSVNIISADEMRELNRVHRGKDKTTDVLSFPFLELAPGEVPTHVKYPFDVNPETGKIELGDIVINEDEAEKEALAEHGLLHLLGFHHDDHQD